MGRVLRVTGATDAGGLGSRRRDRAQAQYIELKTVKARRQLLERAVVVRDGTAFIAAVTAKLRLLPSRLVRAGLIPPTAEKAVAEWVADMQGQMAAWKTSLDLLAAAGADAHPQSTTPRDHQRIPCR